MFTYKKYKKGKKENNVGNVAILAHYEEQVVLF
jgi:hypothetical protein